MSYHKDQNEVIKAENEDVSDVDYYKEEYPENIIDINDEEAHHLDLNIDEENYGQIKTNARKKKNIFPIQCLYYNEYAVAGNWVNTHLSIWIV